MRRVFLLLGFLSLMPSLGIAQYYDREDDGHQRSYEQDRESQRAQQRAYEFYRRRACRVRCSAEYSQSAISCDRACSFSYDGKSYEYGESMRAAAATPRFARRTRNSPASNASRTAIGLTRVSPLFLFCATIRVRPS
jgi:hypothetical protein